ncbi:MAG: nucleotide 5'-monophosphate nucleosidase PpnN [Deltaproteobacteria bacterium]|nr:nucleotide 5'-monophosphate nucleosidase PpnN [Deltaproteobacteria bacterium]
MPDPDKVAEYRLTPEGTCLETLSPLELEHLWTTSRDASHPLLVRCLLAVLNSMSGSDDVAQMLEDHQDFEVEVNSTPGGVELVLRQAPAVAFVAYESSSPGETGPNLKLIEGLRQHLFAVLRDLAFVRGEMASPGKFRLTDGPGLTDAVFLILRNARVFTKTGPHKIVTFWGGHSIGEEEYDYSVDLGAECGLRLMDVITGCGQGAMRGPMEGAAVGHARQRVAEGRYLGLTEPGIIASEAPNPIVKPLVILPDIEKRLEAFVRLGHGVVVFPGGVGTLEEISYLLGVLAHPANRDLPFPLIFSGPPSAAPYFELVLGFFRRFLGDAAVDRGRVLLGDPAGTAQALNRGLLAVKAFRDREKDSYYFNYSLHVPYLFQEPFPASHETVAQLALTREQAPYKLAAMLRRAFSAVVSGNVRPEGMAAVAREGPFRFGGDPDLVAGLGELLGALAAQGRMKLGGAYRPSYATD